jgi:NADH dehydrogenase
MKVFVTGGAGFVGRSVIEALLAKGHAIHALVNQRPLERDGVKSFPGGLFDNAALDAGMSACDAVVHLVGIIAEKPTRGITFDRIHHQGTKQVVDAANRNEIKRYVQMSALGAAPNAPAMYHRTKFLAEEYVRGSGLDWTIFQPSLIHGPGGDFSKMEEGWARGNAIPFFFMPYFGGGLLGLATPTKIQPVFVEDVARAFAESVEDSKKAGEVFPMGGPEQMTWPQMHRTAAMVVAGRRKPVVAIPAWYAKAITRVIPAPLLPFTRDQVVMSQQDNICDLTKFISAFGWIPQAFEKTLRSYTIAC